jgi:hypothetical protein
MSTLEAIYDPDASRLRLRAAAVAAIPGPVPHTRELVADLVPRL